MIRQAVALVLEGRSLGRICQTLNDAGHLTGYNRPWTSGTLSKVLRSPTLLGQRRYSGDLYRDEDGRPVQVTEPIISEADLKELVRRPVFYEDRYPDEASPKRTPERGQGYSIGKVTLERMFTEAAAASGSWDCIRICPADNVGPILSAHQKEKGPWQHNIEMMLLGKYYQNGAYRPWMTVDVRDDAECHIRLLENVDIENGDRFIAWSTDTRNVEDVCASIDRLLPELGHATPEVTDPFPERIQAREQEMREIWAQCELRNDRIRNAIGIEFRPLDESIRDCVESLLQVAEVKPVLREGFAAPN